jgi:hypothetical protein
MVKIYCPVCAWRPRASDRWVCVPGCGTSWNTFDTHGVCPGCSFQWRSTACLSCGQWSPHDDWYHDESPNETVALEKEATEQVAK